MGRPLPPKQPWPAMVFGHFRNTEMVRDKRYKLVLRDQGKGPGELFDLLDDPREMRNLYDDPGFVTVRQRLSRELDLWRKKTS
jgi:hypothetical protein